MSNSFFDRINKTNLLVALGVWVVSLAVYVKTLSPTVSFWDCGEFIAVSAILGIPHPPGAPLYVIIGRIFSMVPIFDDISARVNFLSAVSSAFTALFCYLIGVRVLRFWFNNDGSKFTEFLIYAGSVSGALLAAFGLTNWNNSVEAEVYGLSMVLFTLMFWLTLLFLEKRETASGHKLVLLVFYLAFLGISVHMNSFLVVPVLALAFIMKKETPQFIWFVLAAFVAFELYLIFALSSQPDEVPYYIPILLVFVVFLFFIFSFEQLNRLYLITAAGFAISIAPVYPEIYKSAMLSAGRSISMNMGGSSGLVDLGVAGFLLLIAFAVFCLLKYLNGRKKKKADVKYIHVVSFIFTAALMTVLLTIDQIKGYESFLVLSVITTAVVALVVYKYIDWAILIAIFGPLLIVLGVKQFLYGSLVSLAILAVLGLMFKLKNWKTAALIIVVSWVGFSSHLFIPIRSSQQPAINENNPSLSVQATINYLERKQYGSQSMVSRMFSRRAEWTNQFGNFQRMGFWGFFSEQFGLKGSAFVFPFLVGIFGVWEIVRRRSTRGVLLLLTVLLSSIGLVLYMNFADGTRINPMTGGDYLEVRERDYFFTPSYIYFGLCIGLGIATVLHYLRETVKNAAPIVSKAVLGISSLLFIFPIVTLAQNYHYADRTGNYMAFDYGWNLLQSADKNAIFFTNGDNDTFPLWCLQQAYGIRKDVRVVNLSLANTNWYIKQLNPNLDLNFSLSDEQIDNLRPFRNREGTIIRIHHQVADRLIDENFGIIPINFSVSVGGDNRYYKGHSIDSMLSLVGFSWRLNSENRGFSPDVEESYDFFMDPKKFKCRSAADPEIYLDDTSERLSHNIANGFLVLADSLRKAKDYERAEKLLIKARKLIPRADSPLQVLARVYMEKGDLEMLKTLIDTSTYGSKEIMLTALGQAYRQNGESTLAEAAFNRALALSPRYRPAFDELMRLYMHNNKPNAMRAGILRWLQYNPDDLEVREILDKMQDVMRGGDTNIGGDQ